MERLPVIRILAGSILISWREKGRFSSALALPTLLLVMVWALHTVFQEEIRGISPWLPMPFYLIAFSIFAVTCHRLILMEHEKSPFRISLYTREIRFVSWLILVYGLYFLVLMVITGFAINLPGGTYLVDITDKVYSPTQLLYIPAMYIFARLSLVFPATAIDEKAGLGWSWVNTRRNGWRLVVIVGMYPWLTNSLISLLSREGATILEQTMTGLLYYAGCAQGVFALSLSYKYIITGPDRNAFGA